VKKERFANMLNRTDFSSIPTTLRSSCCLGWTKARLRPKICDQSPNSAEKWDQTFDFL